jgi:hypothetical protein
MARQETEHANAPRTTLGKTAAYSAHWHFAARRALPIRSATSTPAFVSANAVTLVCGLASSVTHASSDSRVPIALVYAIATTTVDATSTSARVSALPTRLMVTGVAATVAAAFLGTLAPDVNPSMSASHPTHKAVFQLKLPSRIQPPQVCFSLTISLVSSTLGRTPLLLFTGILW